MFAIFCQLSPHLKQVVAASSEIYLEFPMARSQNSESPLLFILDPESPLSKLYPSHFYPGTNISIPLVTFYRSDFLVSFERLKTMVPNGIIYNDSIGYKADWEYNMDIETVTSFLRDRKHNIKTVIINTGPHYNSIQFGGGIDLGAMQEIYRSAIEYISGILETHLRIG